MATPAPAGSARSSAATTRWTATSAGTGSSSPTTCSSTAAPSTRRDSGEAAARERVRARRDRRVHHAGAGRRGGADPPRRLRVRRSTSAPTGCARSPARSPMPSFDEIDRGGAGVIERYATMTEYEEGWPYPVAFPPEHPATTLSTVIAARGDRQLHVAETEKYPHVTYFFNGGEEEPCRGRAARARALAARRADLRLQARDERPRGRRGVRRRRGRPTRRRSGSSTSPTPTWSATPA